MHTVTALLDRPTVVTTDELSTAYRAHHQRAVRLAYLLCSDREMAEDAVANVWLKVHRRMGRGPIDDVGAYVRRAVVNEVNSGFRRLGLMRREMSRRRGDDRGQRGHEEQVADSAAMVQALARLPERTRTAVVLRYYLDLSVADTAATMGISEGTVKSSVSRGLEQLRAYLEEGQP
ncbi:MAG TPA: sigma-70 family RNA polymerase sigma factor [Euzebya sp.]|nr:sigma-70 family RNA polymerase sigma factor [Euzebya sp.]